MRTLQNLSSLNALRVFEAVARRRSFAQAADELHVTPGAVSHQIAALERALGMTLFVRDTRGVAPTPAAEACLPLLTAGFDALREALRVLQADRETRVLAVSVAPGFASRWLMPRLASFTAAHPEIALQLSTGLGLIDAVRLDAATDKTADHGSPADVAIRFGRGLDPGRHADKLFATAVTPVCSPRLATGPHPLRAPRDLAHHVLLHDDTAYFNERRADWTVWLDAAGAGTLDATRGPRFNHSGLALDAAADGLGVALGLTLLVAHDVAAGRLVMPFALRLPSPFAYHLVYPETAADRPELVAFRGWLLDEARKTEAAEASEGA